MKLKKAFIIGAAAVLVLVIGAVIGYIAGGHRPGNPAPNTLAASPAVQNTSSPSVNVNLPELRGAKSVSDATNLIESVTEGELPLNSSVSRSPSDGSTGYFYRSFVIKFKQGMDASTLNSQNILGFINTNPTEVSCDYNAGLNELQIDIRIDANQGDINTATIYVLLTKNIKTADGKTIGNDYNFAVANNR